MPELTQKLNELNESVSLSDIKTVKEWNDAFLNVHRAARKAYTHSFGCSQNVADGEKINGLLSSMGYPSALDITLKGAFVADGTQDVELPGGAKIRVSMNTVTHGNVFF